MGRLERLEGHSRILITNIIFSVFFSLKYPGPKLVNLNSRYCEDSSRFSKILEDFWRFSKILEVSRKFSKFDENCQVLRISRYSPFFLKNNSNNIGFIVPIYRVLQYSLFLNAINNINKLRSYYVKYQKLYISFTLASLLMNLYICRRN